MSERKGSKQRSLDFEVGGQDIRLIAKMGDHWILNTAKKYLKEYQIYHKEVGNKVWVIPYPYIYRHPWDNSELDRFRRYFLLCHHRFPSDKQTDRVDQSLRILQYMNPADECVRDIRRMIEGQKMTYAQVGMDLFFFNTEAKTAYLFVGETFSRFPLPKCIMQGFNIGQDILWTGILNGIMFVLSHLLIYENGLLLHGTALQKDGHGLLFLGLSGAGKSTITRLVRPDICFSDDGVVIKKEAETVFAYFSPFRQFNGTGKNRDTVKSKIQKIFLLEKADKNRVLPLKKCELMDLILKHMIHFYKFMDGDTVRKGFYCVKDMVESLPVYRLQFSKREDIWDNIILTTGSEVDDVG